MIAKFCSDCASFKNVKAISHYSENIYRISLQYRGRLEKKIGAKLTTFHLIKIKQKDIYIYTKFYNRALLQYIVRNAKLEAFKVF